MTMMVHQWRCKFGWHPYEQYGWAKRRCSGCGRDEAYVYKNGKSGWVDNRWSVKR
jgi:hypothetical protein